MRAATPHILNDLPNHEINIPPCQSHGRDGWNGMAPYCNRQIWNAFSTLSSSFIPFLFSFHFFVIGVMPFKRLSLSRLNFFFCSVLFEIVFFLQDCFCWDPPLDWAVHRSVDFSPSCMWKVKKFSVSGPRKGVCVFFFFFPQPLELQSSG